MNKLSGVFKYDVEDNKDYVRGFIHEYKRRGFQYFLNDQNLPCEKIDEGAVLTRKKRPIWCSAVQVKTTTCNLITKAKYGAYRINFNR